MADQRVSHPYNPSADKPRIACYSWNELENRYPRTGGYLWPLGHAAGVPNCEMCAKRLDAIADQRDWGLWGVSYLNPEDPADEGEPNMAWGRVCEFCFHFSALHEDVSQGRLADHEATILFNQGNKAFNNWAIDRALDFLWNKVMEEEETHNQSFRWDARKWQALVQSADLEAADLSRGGYLVPPGPVSPWTSSQYMRAKQYIEDIWHNQGVEAGKFTAAQKNVAAQYQDVRYV